MPGRLLAVMILPLALLAMVIAGSRVAAANRLAGTARTARLRAVASSGFAVLAAVAFVLIAPSDAVSLATMPALAAATGVVIAGLGELTFPRPTGERREVSIAVRRGTAVRRLVPLLVAGLASSATLLVVGVVTADATGRGVQRDWPTGAASAGPYPGPPYAVPIGLALAVLALATWWSLRRVDARPALGPGLEDVDRAIRIAGRVRVLRLAAAGVLLTAAGLAAAMGTALARLAQNLRMNWVEAPQVPWDWTQNAGFALIALSVAGVLAAVYALLFASPRVPNPEPGRAEATTGVAQQ